MNMLIFPLFNFHYLGDFNPDDLVKGIKNIPSDYKYEFEIERGLYTIKRFNFEEDIKIPIQDFFFSRNEIEDIKSVRWAVFVEECDKTTDNIIQEINLLLLAFRIFKQADCQIQFILSRNFEDNQKVTTPLKYAIANNLSENNFSANDLEVIKTGFQKIKEFTNLSPRSKHAIDFLFLGYSSYYWMQVFILLMTSLETLILPEKIGGITTYVEKRTFAFLKDPIVCPEDKMRNLYGLRSDIIHGKILVDLDFTQEIVRLKELQMIVLTFFKKLLEQDFKSIFKNEISKETFFNNIV